MAAERSTCRETSYLMNKQWLTSLVVRTWKYTADHSTNLVIQEASLAEITLSI